MVAEAQRSAHSALIVDPLLSAAAACVTSLGDTSEAVNGARVRYCCDKAGVYDSKIVPLFVASSNEDEVRATLRGFFADAQSSHLSFFGAALSRRNGATILGVVTAERVGTLTLDGPAHKDHVLNFHGVIVGSSRNAHALLSSPNGKTSPALLTLDKNHFTGRAQVGSDSGRYQLEVLADGDDGPHVVANLAVFADSAPARSPPALQPLDRDPPVQRLLSLMNQERAKNGASPLRLLPNLSTIADTHARDMRDHAYFAHQANAADTLPSRLQKAGIDFSRAAENLAAAPNADDAHASLMASPGHRTNVLDANLSEVGIGVEESRVLGGAPVLLFVIDFIAPVAAQSPLRLEKELITRINDRRAAAHLSPITRNKALSDVALSQSRAMAEADTLAYVPSQEAFFHKATLAAGETDMHSDIMLGMDASALDKASNVLSPATRLGIGVAAAPHSRYGDGLYWMTLIFAN